MTHVSAKRMPLAPVTANVAVIGYARQGIPGRRRLLMVGRFAAKNDHLGRMLVTRNFTIARRAV